jgi:tRNA pseudouridine38-40 synthase
MRGYRMLVAYDGTDYAGWQIQPGLATVQGQLEAALERILGGTVRVVASGRTDAGVHALGQVVSFRCETRLNPAVLRRAINAHTPDAIHVRELCEVAEGFHAIRDAVAKRYRYVIHDGGERDVFCRGYSWQMPCRLDVERMDRAARHLVGTHDFRSFESAGAPRKTSVRTVAALQLNRFSCHGTRPIGIEVEADGFLYHMVRNIVGSLVLVGRGDRPEDWAAELLAAGDRSGAGATAPARGLMLLSVRYADACGASRGGEGRGGESLRDEGDACESPM